MHSNVVLNDVLRGETAEIFLKSRTLNGAFLRYLKQCFVCWDCRETFENKDANWYFLAVFKTIIWKLELYRNPPCPPVDPPLNCIVL